MSELDQKRKNFFTQFIVTLPNSQPQDVVTVTSLEALKPDWTNSWRQQLLIMMAVYSQHDSECRLQGRKGGRRCLNPCLTFVGNKMLKL